MKKRILFVATEYAPGMIPFATTIINTLSADPHFDVHSIVVSSGKHSYKNLIESSAHPVFIEYPKSRLAKLIYKIYPVQIIKAIRNRIKKKDIDVVHFLTGEFSLAFYILLNKNDARFYYTVHDLYPHEQEKTSLMRFLLHKYILWGNKVNRESILNLTTSSHSQINELKKMYPAKNIKFTHFPSLVTSEIAAGGLKVPELEKVNKYILFFGSVDKYKGVDLLIQAYNNSERLQTVKLVIAGKGQNYTCNNTHIIRINRFIDDHELSDLFSNASIVVYPYRSATMSGVLSLAYYFKKQVLVSSIPFFIDNISPDTNLFEANNVIDLRYKLENMYMKGEQKNIYFYEQVYSKDILKEDYFQLYFE